MRIKTILKLNALGSLISILLALGFLILSVKEEYRVKQREDVLGKMYAAFLERSLLRSEYMLHRDKHLLKNWEKINNLTSEIIELARNRFVNPSDIEVLNRLKNDSDSAVVMFNRITENITEINSDLAFSESERLLFSRIFVTFNSILDKIGILKRSVQQASSDAQQKTIMIMSILISVTMIFSICNIVFIYLKLTKGISELIKGSRIIGNGNLEYRILITGSNELAELAGVINIMSTQLYKFYTSIDALNAEIVKRREAEEKLRTTLYSIGDAVIATETGGRITQMNSVAEHLTGWTEADAAGKPLVDVFHIINENTREVMENPLNLILAEGAVTGLSNHTLLVSKDGKERPIADSGAPIRRENGEISGVVLVFRDQTKDRNAENAMQEQNKFLSTIINSLEYPFLVIDAHTYKVKMANLAAMTEYKEDVTCYELRYNLKAPCSDFGKECIIEKIKQEKKHLVTEYIHDEDKANPKYFEVHGHPIFDQNNNVYQVIQYVIDITERKKNDRERIISLEKYKVLFDSFPLCIAITNDSGEILECNENSCKLLGISKEEPARRMADSRIIRSDRTPMPPNEYPGVRALKEKCPVENVEMGIVESDGAVTWFSVSAAPIPLEGFGIAITYNNISQTKEAEFNLRKLTNELEQRVEERTAEVHDLYNNAPCGYHSLDPNGVIIHINDTELKWLGYEREEIIGKKIFSDLLTEKGAEEFRHNFFLLKTQGKISGLEYDMVCKNGSVLPVILSATAIYDSKGNYIKNRVTIFDITVRKQIENRLYQKSEELSKANSSLEKASRLKDEFLASMSHELRTPLNTILNLSESLREQIYGKLNEKQIRAVHSIEKSGQHLLDLINDILDLSKIEAGYMELEMEKCSVNDICQSALQLIKEMADNKRQSVSFVKEPGTACLYADARRVMQMLVNLLSNAVKFTPEQGHIGLEVTGDNVKQVIQFAVWDTGIGIPATDFDRLFKPFIQLDSCLAREYSGTGLGLSLVKRMAELHGGIVTFESEVGKGSRFTVALPWKTDNTPQLSEPLIPLSPDSGTMPMIASSLPLILLVEDNEDNIITYMDFLTSKGYPVAIARNGMEGIQKAQELNPAIILMDIQMPGMDGLEATRRIRDVQNPEIASVPIIALTALAMPGDRERCMAAGVSHYLSKPIKLKSLIDTIEKYLNQN